MEILGSTFVKSVSKPVMDYDCIGKAKLEENGYHQGPRINEKSTYFVKPCEARIYFRASDDYVVCQDLRKQICALYNLKRLTKPRFQKFLQEVENGNIILKETRHHHVDIHLPV